MNKFPWFLTLLLLNYTSLLKAQFEGNTVVLQQHNGSGFYGWAVADLQDINDDAVTDYMIGSTGSSLVEVYSGADGVLVHSFSLPGSSLGYALADAGDVNNDGIHDVIAGGTLSNGSAGVAMVYSGLNGAVIRRHDGVNSGDRFGAAVSSAGDVDGDGYSDYLVGAESHSSVANFAGRVYLYSGQTGQLIRSYDGESSLDRFGGGVALLGDLNDDDINDHIVGAYGAGVNQGGKAYVYSGASGGLLFELNPDDGANVFGQFFVANASDVNNDGVDDIYVGDYNHGGGAGRAYVFSGSNQQVLHRFSGTAGAGAGPGRYAGDVNNDGYADLIVGYYTAQGNQAGRVDILSGADGSVLQSMVHTVARGQLGFDAVGIGDVNGDKMDDYLVSAANGNAVYVVSGTVEKRANININPGMNGAWFNPNTAGQGIFVSVFPEQNNVFIGMFTFDVAVNNDDSATLGHANHRWLTAFGPIDGSASDLQVFLTTGGAFDDPAPVNTIDYGTMQLNFSDCLNAVLTYSLPSLNLVGSIPLTRPTAENVTLCEMLSAEIGL